MSPFVMTTYENLKEIQKYADVIPLKSSLVASTYSLKNWYEV